MSRVLLITNILAPYRIPVFCELNRALAGKLSVVCVAETEAKRSWEIHRNGFPFDYRILKPGLMPKTLAEQNSVARRMWSVLQEVRPEAIISGGYNHLPAWMAYLYARLRRVRFLLWVESNANDLRKASRLRECLKRRIVQGADGIVVPGQASAEYARLLGAAREKIYIAPNAVDNDFFAQEAARVDVARERARRGFPAKLLLFVGRLVREKGVHEFLGAFQKVSQEMQDVGLVILGDGPERKALERICEQRQMTHVYFEGFRQQEELPYFYALADLLVFPTRSDPWGLVVNEAFACGVPAIVSRVAGACQDLIMEGETGFAVEPGDVEELASKILRLLRDKVLRAQMSRNCRRLIEKYSVQACAQGLLSAIQNTR